MRDRELHSNVSVGDDAFRAEAANTVGTVVGVAKEVAESELLELQDDPSVVQPGTQDPEDDDEKQNPVAGDAN